MSRAGVDDKRVTCHTFRHPFSTRLLANITDIRTVEDILGHSELKTTQIYTHVRNTSSGPTSFTGTCEACPSRILQVHCTIRWNYSGCDHIDVASLLVGMERSC
ncbi:MAG: tyrosine-type recombinase/integrase [Gammaproteobacteria bacterium]